jgi:hypothetical protein
MSEAIAIEQGFENRKVPQIFAALAGMPLCSVNGKSEYLHSYKN